MEQWHGGGSQRVLLQQLDDPAIPASPAALHPAQLLPLPEVRGCFTALLVVLSSDKVEDRDALILQLD